MMIGAFLGFAVGAVMTLKIIWPWVNTFVSGTTGSMFEAIWAGILAALIPVVVVISSGPGRHGIVILVCIFAFTFVFGIILAGNTGRVLVTLVPGLFLTASVTAIGFKLNRPITFLFTTIIGLIESINENKQRKKQAIVEERRRIEEHRKRVREAEIRQREDEKETGSPVVEQSPQTQNNTSLIFRNNLNCHPE